VGAREGREIEKGRKSHLSQRNQKKKKKRKKIYQFCVEEKVVLSFCHPVPISPILSLPQPAQNFSLFILSD
jgi:hypothetical protein